ncbi:putative nucleolar protein 5-1 [Iris pallida]|uniref:Nucleolar protein 5-1 n=1 Tax=Iris pallida TaxID=29817 RepID=A0AAX6G711_IRIPA|nr:putative nucleolar protein 5-1 [Iris pallida]
MSILRPIALIDESGQIRTRSSMRTPICDIIVIDFYMYVLSFPILDSVNMSICFQDNTKMCVCDQLKTCLFRVTQKNEFGIMSALGETQLIDHLNRE